MSDETPDTPDAPKDDGTPNVPPDPTKRRPKDSEFLELPPDLKKLPPGGLPATASAGPAKPKSEPDSGAKKGCGGMILFAVGTAAAAACALLVALV